MASNVTTYLHGVPWETSGYSQGYMVDGTAYISGQLSHDLSGKMVFLGDITGQTRQSLENLDRVLQGLGLDRTHLASVELLLTNVREDYEAAVKVFTAYLGDHHPAVTLYGVTGLAFPEQLIEISAVAHA